MKTIDKITNNEVYFKFIRNTGCESLFPIAVGYEKCSPEKLAEGPFVKKHYIMHFVISGSGFYFVENKKYLVKKESLFLITPNLKIEYMPDRDDPWEYFWIEMNGSSIKNLLKNTKLSKFNPVCKFSNPKEIKNVFTKILECTIEKVEPSLNITALIYELFGEINSVNIDGSKDTVKTKEQNFVSKAIDYIHTNYSSPNLNIESICELLSISKSHFQRSFKLVTGNTFIKYLTDFRMQKACELLNNPNNKVKTVSLSVGYVDQFYFSRVFTQTFKVAPSDYYRKTINNNI